MQPTTIASHANYSDVTFKNLEQTHDRIEGTRFADCTFNGCNFSETVFQSCRFLDCDFIDCTMKMTTVPGTTLARVGFKRCSLLGVNWTEADWEAWSTKLSRITFADCDLKYSVFFALELKQLKLTNCTAHEANFAEADLTDADFAGTDLQGAIFLRTNLTRANFVGASHYALNLNDNPSKGAKFALPEAVNLLYHMDITIVDPNDSA